jgi:hypothetical protein
MKNFPWVHSMVCLQFTCIHLCNHNQATQVVYLCKTYYARPHCSRTPCVFSLKFFKGLFGIFFSKSDHSNHILDQTTNYKRLHSIINPISGSNRWFFSGRNGLGASWEGPNKSSFNFIIISQVVYTLKKDHIQMKNWVRSHRYVSYEDLPKCKTKVNEKIHKLTLVLHFGKSSYDTYRWLLTQFFICMWSFFKVYTTCDIIIKLNDDLFGPSQLAPRPFRPEKNHLLEPEMGLMIEWSLL